MCPEDGNYDSCEIADGYVKIVGKSNSKMKVNSQKHNKLDFKPIGIVNDTRNLELQVPNPGSLVQAPRSTSSGIFFSLVTYLKKLQAKGVEYAFVNQYLRAEFKALGDNNPMGVGFISDALTFDPRQDPPKDYPDIFTALKQMPSSIDLTSLAGIISGLDTF